MKKTYAKPEIMFEDFSLSTSIALGCALGAHHQENMCPYEDEELGMIIFLDKSMGCADLVQDGAHNGLCYHVPNPAMSLFAS